MRITAVALFVGAIWAGAVGQDAQQAPPPVPLVQGNDRDTSSNEAELKPDTRSITGARPLTLGSALERSYLLPSIQLTEAVTSNPAGVSGQSDTEGQAYLSGNVALEKLWSRSQLVLHYMGGGLLSEGGSSNSSFYQQFGLSQSFLFRRWSLSFFDNGSYVPESPFGFFGLTNFPGSTNFQQTNLNGSLIPNQSILTGQAPRWSNMLTSQVDYTISRRTSVTGVAGFGTLRSSDPQFLDSTQGHFSVGVNYAVGPKDTVGITYGNTIIAFGSSESASTLVSHSVQGVYARRITGRFALRLSGGAQMTSSDTFTAGLRTSWISGGSLTYGLRGGAVRLSYDHGVTGGAGVFAGASTHILHASLTRQLSRMIAGTVSAGYAHNTPLTSTGSGITQGTFNTEYLAASFSRPLGRETGVYITYNLQHQSSGTALCANLLCDNSTTRHVLGLGINWHMRPLPLGR